MTVNLSCKWSIGSQLALGHFHLNSHFGSSLAISCIALCQNSCASMARLEFRFEYTIFWPDGEKESFDVALESSTRWILYLGWERNTACFVIHMADGKPSTKPSLDGLIAKIPLDSAISFLPSR